MREPHENRGVYQLKAEGEEQRLGRLQGADEASSIIRVGAWGRTSATLASLRATPCPSGRRRLSKAGGRDRLAYQLSGRTSALGRGFAFSMTFLYGGGLTGHPTDLVDWH